MTARVVINLAGRSVNCRYTAENLRAMMDSRVMRGRAVAAHHNQESPWPLEDDFQPVVSGAQPSRHGYWTRHRQLDRSLDDELQRCLRSA